jgi:uncharacterized protein YecA (UPF0149 family)
VYSKIERAMNLIKSIDEMKKRYIKPEIKQRKIQNNDPCPCGSGRKFKYCHKPGKKRSK